MTNKDAYLESRALWALRLARDEHDYHGEETACAFAVGALRGSGASGDSADRAVAKVWHEKFEALPPV